MKRITIAKVLSLAASVMGAIALYTMFLGKEDAGALAVMTMFLSPMLALVSYCLCGFFKALGTPFSAAKWGFLIAPFPFSLVAVVVLFIAGCLSVVYIPVIPVFKRAAELGC